MCTRASGRWRCSTRAWRWLSITSLVTSSAPCCSRRSRSLPHTQGSPTARSRGRPTGCYGVWMPPNPDPNCSVGVHGQGSYPRRREIAILPMSLRTRLGLSVQARHAASRRSASLRVDCPRNCSMPMSAGNVGIMSGGKGLDMGSMYHEGREPRERLRHHERGQGARQPGHAARPLGVLGMERLVGEAGGGQPAAGVGVLF